MHAKHGERTDVHRLIFLPKKAFKSFCTWMLLPTVLYTPSCVSPGEEREEDGIKESGEKH